MKKILIVIAIGFVVISTAFYLKLTNDKGYCISDSDCIAYDACCANYECMNKHSKKEICSVACGPDAYEDVLIPECECVNSKCVNR